MTEPLKLAVVGHTNVGKTSLLRALAGLVDSTGELQVAGEDPRRASAQANARRRAYCAQKPTSAWDYRVNDLGEIVGAPEAFTEWLARLGLNELGERRLTRLSGGEQKAAHLAMTFASLADPFGTLLLLDEPVAGMTDFETERTAELFLTLKGKHSLMVVEHDMGFIRTISDIVTVLCDGSVLAQGTLDQVQADERVIEVYLGR